MQLSIQDALQRRHASKAFDASRKLPDDVVQKILDVLRWMPSSTNIQPWHFIVASTDEGKARIAKGAAGPYGYNEPKILDASHVVLFCSRTSVDEQHLQKVLAAEEQAGRFKDYPQAREAAHNTRVSYHGFHKFERKDVPHWLEKQIYLNMGGALLSAGLLDIDAVPMEGVNQEVLNEEFDLNAQDLVAVAAVAFGYHSEEDFNAKLPKGCLAAEDIFTFV